MWVIGLLLLSVSCQAQYENLYAMASSWSQWSAWSFCSNNVMVRVRACSTFRGFKCVGHNKEFQSCNSNSPNANPNNVDYDVTDGDRNAAMKQLYQDYDPGEIAPTGSPRSLKVRPARPVIASNDNPNHHIIAQNNKQKEQDIDTTLPPLTEPTTLPSYQATRLVTGPEPEPMPLDSKTKEVEPDMLMTTVEVPETVVPRIISQSEETAEKIDPIKKPMHRYKASYVTKSPRVLEQLDEFNRQEFFTETVMLVTQTAPSRSSSYPIVREHERDDWSSESAEVFPTSRLIEEIATVTQSPSTTEFTTASTTEWTEPSTERSIEPTTELYTTTREPTTEYTTRFTPVKTTIHVEGGLTIPTPMAPAVFAGISRPRYVNAKMKSSLEMYSHEYMKPIHKKKAKANAVPIYREEFVSSVKTSPKSSESPVTVEGDIDMITGDTAKALSWMLANMTALVEDGPQQPIVDRIPLERVEEGNSFVTQKVPERVEPTMKPRPKKHRKKPKTRWSQWSLWSDCNCNVQRRKRVCLPRKSTKTTCPPAQYEEKSCVSNDCI